MTGCPEASFRPAQQPKNPPLHRHPPKTLFQWWCREAAGEIPPGFLLSALTDWSPIHRAECCLAIFP